MATLTTEGTDAPLTENGQGLGCNGIDERKKSGADDNEPRILNGMDEVSWKAISCITMYKFFFHLYFVI